MIWYLVNLIFKFSGKIYFSGKKNDWSSALKLSKSYEDKTIFNKTKKTYEQVKKNKEFYERDGLILKNKPNESHLIRFIKKNLDLKKNIEILDYGGSLGSRFFSNYLS